MFSSIIGKHKHLMDHAQGFEIALEILDKVLDNPEETFPIIEVGVNYGGSSLCFLDLLQQKNKRNWLYTVDPYGAIPYSDGKEYHDSVYNDDRYMLAMKEIYDFVFTNKMNYYHFKYTSKDFIESVYPFYKQHEKESHEGFTKFSFVHLDGDHHPDTVKEEIKFFLENLSDNGYIVVDDTEHRATIYSEFLKSLDGNVCRQEGQKTIIHKR